VTGATTQTFNATINTGTLAPNATQNITVGTLNMTTGGAYNFSLTASTPADANTINNNITSTSTTRYSVIAPYTESFPTNTPAGWVTTGWLITATHNNNANGSTNNGLYRNLWSSATTGQFSMTKVDGILNNYVLSFDYRIVDYTSYPATATTLGAGNKIVFQVSTDCGQTYTDLDSITSTNHVTALTWANKVYSLSAQTGQNIIIRANAQWASGDYFIDFDNFFVGPVTTCNAPTGLAVANIGMNSADITWTSGSGALNDSLAYGPVGFVPRTGGTHILASSPYALTGLTTQTQYSVFVRSNCGVDGSSIWVGPLNFQTLCSPQPYPGTTTAVAINIPTTPYSTTGNNGSGCYSNLITSQASPEVYYSITTNACTDSLTISLCGSNFDTYVRLLDSLGVQVGFNDDANTICGNTNNNSYLKANVNGNTKYFIAVEGFNVATGNYALNVDQIVRPVTASLTNSTNITCNGDGDGTINISATGGNSALIYSWSNGSTTQNQTALQAGTYSVTVADMYGCNATVLNTVIAEPAVLGAAVDGITHISCNGGSNGMIMTTATGGTAPYTYMWSNGATTDDIMGISAGTYTLDITDSKGCVHTSANITVIQPDVLAINPTVTNISCNGGNNGSITNVAPTGGTSPYTYLWSNGATTADLTGLAVGTYSGTITDTNGCTLSTNAIDITQPAAITLGGLPTVTNVSCNGGSNGSVTGVVVVGGTTPYTYLWSNGATTADLTGLAAGTYTGTVTDANGCTYSPPVPLTITEPAAITASSAVTNVACNGGNNGAINITVSGGTTGYTYRWSNSATTEDLIGLTAGSYTVTITDANSCTAVSASFAVAQPSVLGVAVSTTPEATTNSGTATANVTGGTAPYTYTWSNGQTAATATGLAFGTYTVTIVDANGCSSIGSGNVTYPIGVQNLTDAYNIALYPNPTTHQSQLNIEFVQTKTVRVEIVDILGRTVADLGEQTTIKANYAINVDNLSEGTYMVRILVNQSNVITKKLVVTK
jgi:hypothetical protein